MSSRGRDSGGARDWRSATRQIAVERGDGFSQGVDRQHLEAGHEAGLGGVGGGQQQLAIAIAPGAGRNRQHATCRVHRTVERELADDERVARRPARHDPAGRQHAEGNREVERRAGLSHVGGCEIHGDAFLWELEPRVADRGLHAIAALADGRVRQSDHHQRRQSEAQVDFDGNGDGLDAVQCRRLDRGQHARRSCKERGGACRCRSSRKDGGFVATRPRSTRFLRGGLAVLRAGTATRDLQRRQA